MIIYHTIIILIYKYIHPPNTYTIRKLNYSNGSRIA